MPTKNIDIAEIRKDILRIVNEKFKRENFNSRDLFDIMKTRQIKNNPDSVYQILRRLCGLAVLKRITLKEEDYIGREIKRTQDYEYAVGTNFERYLRYWELI